MMGRRWLIEVPMPADVVLPPEEYRPKHLYISRRDELPVTITYASKFVTRRAATDEANRRGLSNFKVIRTWT